MSHGVNKELFQFSLRRKAEGGMHGAAFLQGSQRQCKPAGSSIFQEMLSFFKPQLIPCSVNLKLM